MRVMAWLALGLMLWAVKAEAQTKEPLRDPERSRWTDWSVEEAMQAMTLKQKIGQLMVVPVYAQSDTADAQVLRWLEEEEVGGLIWMKGRTEHLRKLLPMYQKAAALPLWSSMDAEWGAAMSMEDCLRFPYASTMGACGDTLLVET
ncbi:MAG: hypothetical protein ACKODJ_03670, partial [Bacteroidota bacterium]